MFACLRSTRLRSTFRALRARVSTCSRSKFHLPRPTLHGPRSTPHAPRFTCSNIYAPPCVHVPRVYVLRFNVLRLHVSTRLRSMLHVPRYASPPVLRENSRVRRGTLLCDTGHAPGETREVRACYALSSWSDCFSPSSSRRVCGCLQLPLHKTDPEMSPQGGPVSGT